MAGVVEGEDADVTAAAKLKSVDAAIGGDEPRRCFCVTVDRTHQMQREEADGSSVRIDGDTLAVVLADQVVEFCGDTPE